VTAPNATPVRTLEVNPFVGSSRVVCKYGAKEVELPGRSPREMAANVIDYANNIDVDRVAVHAHGLGQLVYDELRLAKPEGVTVVRL